MAFSPGDVRTVGLFREADVGNYFEYSMADDYQVHIDLHTGMPVEYPHLVWVTTPRERIDCGYRRALVKKTVAYIVVDEDENGPVVERWKINQHSEFEFADRRPPSQRMLDKIADSIAN